MDAPERKHYERLVGYTVVEVDEAHWGADDLPALILRRNFSGPDLIVTVSCDPEGNGPGHLFIEEVQS